MKHIRKISEYAVVGGLGALLIIGISGCEQKDNHSNSNAFEQAQKQGAFVVIEEVSPGNYKIVEEYPSSQTRVILRDINGTEKILSKEELDTLIKEEAAKIEKGESPLVNSNLHSGGMSLGEVILASAAGAILGSWIGSKLFNNPTFQEQRQQGYKSPSAYQKSVESFKKRASSNIKKSSSTKSGFFSKSGTKSKSLFSFGG